MSSVIKAAQVVVARPTAQQSVHGLAAVDAHVAPAPAVIAKLWLSLAPLHEAALRRARECLERARQEAEAILAAAEDQRQAVLEQARSEGFESGHKQGYESGAAEARAEVEARLAALDAVVGELARARDAALAECEDDMVELALAVAARIVRRESSLGPDTVRELLRETLPRINGVSQVTISVHPDDLTALHDDLAALTALAGRAQVRWEADASVRRGGCFIQTERGGVDATLETRVARLVESLLDVIGHGG